MELPVIHLFTHDSIGVGEDGPTHQPIEQLASLRAMPGLIDLRPGDANEVVEAWRLIMPLRHDPVALILSRQTLPTLDRDEVRLRRRRLANGAYVLAGDPDTTPDVILIATGSEVALAVVRLRTAHRRRHQRPRRVSMPSMELFDRQDQAYRDNVLPPSVTARVADRAGLRLRLAPLGRHPAAPSSRCAPSAPRRRLKELQSKFGFTPDLVVAAARRVLTRTTPSA